jgi:hypothetical protein
VRVMASSAAAGVLLTQVCSRVRGRSTACARVWRSAVLAGCWPGLQLAREQAFSEVQRRGTR